MEENRNKLVMDGKTKLIYRISCWVSGFVMIFVLIYGLIASIATTGGSFAIGGALVNVFWPLPWFAQPVTYLSIASVAFFYSVLRLWEEKMSKWPQYVLSLIQLLGFVIAFASAYEVLYNFMLWGSVFSYNLLLQNKDPNLVLTPLQPPWYLVFATKVFSATFVISGYTVYYIRRLNKTGLI
jgi:hypothetical protein